ncbi:MAG: hypothetical protein RL662_2198 [Bacteroidota bacterium]|jgi:glycosyltransferase involved in cell wall biosynthesis
MNIAILGTRGIPNTYGGFEQFAEYLSVGLVERGHAVTVYNASFHPYNQSKYKGVTICRQYSPEKWIGAAANFIYDYLCLKDALAKDFDIIYELGYHSNAPSYYLLKNNSPIVITNMDGLEWKRSKWNFFTQKLIRKLEVLALKRSHYIISDNWAIKAYYQQEFGKESFYIAYGAQPVDEFTEEDITPYQVVAKNYFLLIARLEPENNIEIILDGFLKSGDKRPFLVIGNDTTGYGKKLRKKYPQNQIRFLGAIYNKQHLDNLRCFSSLYFHGHSVGGTNPSLLEAMASKAFIVAHSNCFNKAVLGEDAVFFETWEDISKIIKCEQTLSRQRLLYSESNSTKIINQYTWSAIIEQYENLFKNLLLKKHKP